MSLKQTQKSSSRASASQHIKMLLLLPHYALSFILPPSFSFFLIPLLSLNANFVPSKQKISEVHLETLSLECLRIIWVLKPTLYSMRPSHCCGLLAFCQFDMTRPECAESDTNCCFSLDVFGVFLFKIILILTNTNQISC